MCNPSTIFILPTEEYRSAREKPELDAGPPEEILNFPNGEPGFYFVRIAYSEQAEELIEVRRHPRRSLVESEISARGKGWKVLHPELDNGVIDDAFDGDLETMTRTLDAQTTIVVVRFPTPRRIEGVRLHLWYDEYDVRLAVVRAVERWSRESDSAVRESS